MHKEVPMSGVIPTLKSVGHSMRAAKNSPAEKIMDCSVEEDLYLAFIDQQIDGIRNMVGVLRKAIIQMVMDEADTKKQSGSLFVIA
jgi:hypothetical protein